MTLAWDCALSAGLYRPLNRTVAQSNPVAANVFSVAATRPLPQLSVVVDRVSSPFLHSLERDLAPIRDLQNGWHGVGSVRISNQVIERVVGLGKTIATVKGLPAPDVTPNSHGTVSLEWDNENISLYVEIGKTRMNGFLKVAGYDPIMIPSVSELSESFFQTIGELLSPSLGVSFTLSEGRVG